MYFVSFLSLAAAASAVVTADHWDHVPPQPEWALLPDNTAGWYKEHGNPVPALAADVTVVEEHKSYIVKLDCPGCPFVVKKGVEKLWQKQDNALLLKFEITERHADVIPTLRLNGAPVLPLGALPVFISAYQTSANLTQETMDRISRERTLDPESAAQKKYRQFPLQWEHTLLRTNRLGQWWLQFDVTGVQYGEEREVVRFEKESHKLVQLLVKQVKGAGGAKDGLTIADIQVVERSQRAQPIKMKCGKLAMVQTTFDPNEWDEYGRLGSWSRAWSKVFAKIGQFWEDNVEHNALLLPVALLLAFVIFFARASLQNRGGCRTLDAEYALVEDEEEDLPPAYSDIPVIKIEEYD